MTSHIPRIPIEMAYTTHTVKIIISARGANLVFGPGEGQLLETERLLKTGHLFSFSNMKRDCIQ